MNELADFTIIKSNDNEMRALQYKYSNIMMPDFQVQWQLVNTKFMGIGILVLVIRTSCYPNKGLGKYYLLSGILCYQVTC